MPIPLGFFAVAGAGAASIGGWFGTITDSSSLNTRPSGGSDSSGNFYASGIRESTPDSIFIVKFNSLGALQWQRTLGSTATETVNATHVTPAGDFFVTGSTTVSGTSNAFLARYNSAGVLQWQVRIGGGTSVDSFGVSADSAGNPHIVTRHTVSDVDRITAIKFNTSGAIQWQTSVRIGVLVPFGITVDGNNDVAISIARLDSSVGIIVAKFNSSGSILFQRSITMPSTFIPADGIGFDSSNDYYIAADPRDAATGQSKFGLLKISNAGSNLVARSYAIAGSNAVRSSRTLPNGTTLLVGPTAGFAGIMAVDSAGNLIFQRQLQISSIITRGFGVGSFESSYFISGINFSSPARTFAARMPINGGGIGTYTVAGQTVAYEASTAVQSSLTTTTTTSSLTVATESLQINTTTLTDAASTFTVTVGAI